jgi:hypothetical protein
MRISGRDLLTVEASTIRDLAIEIQKHFPLKKLIFYRGDTQLRDEDKIEHNEHIGLVVDTADYITVHAVNYNVSRMSDGCGGLRFSP